MIYEYNMSHCCLKTKVNNSRHVYGAAKSQELHLLRGVAIVINSAALHFWLFLSSWHCPWPYLTPATIASLWEIQKYSCISYYAYPAHLLKIWVCVVTKWFHVFWHLLTNYNFGSSRCRREWIIPTACEIEKIGSQQHSAGGAVDKTPSFEGNLLDVVAAYHEGTGGARCWPGTQPSEKCVLRLLSFGYCSGDVQ